MIMQNLLMKARAGRRMALMLRSIHQYVPTIKASVYAPISAVQAPPPHQFLQRTALSEARVRRSL